MANIIIPKGWEIPENQVTPQAVFTNRRKFMQSLGLTTVGAWSMMNSCSKAQDTPEPKTQRTTDEDSTYHPVMETIPKPEGVYPVARNTKYAVTQPMTDELIAASYNNFYEFTTDKDRVWLLAHAFQTNPWSIEISGEVRKPQTLDLDDLLKKLTLEERVYRHRCVEAWSMIVPWTGFTLKSLMDLVEPTSKAKYVRFVSFVDSGQASGIRTQYWYPWPYHEALTMAEAANELTLMATGIYGHALPNQHGAPLRLVVPWKYGFKSIKSIVKIEFVREKPETFWHTMAPDEYSFQANVNPQVSHPRWSQATERVIGTGTRIPTQMYNGYEKFVTHLYKG